MDKGCGSTNIRSRNQPACNLHQQKGAPCGDHFGARLPGNGGGAASGAPLRPGGGRPWGWRLPGKGTGRRQEVQRRRRGGCAVAAALLCQLRQQALLAGGALSSR